MPAIETDLALRIGKGSPSHQRGLVRALICFRHMKDRPVIVEGVFILQTLDAIGISPDLVIRVDLPGHAGSLVWQQKFARYGKVFIRSRSPDFLSTRAVLSSQERELHTE